MDECSVQPVQSGKFQYSPAQTSAIGLGYTPDFDNIDMASYTGLPGAMSMNGSIFSPTVGTMFSPYAPMFGGMGGFGFGDNSYFDNMKNYQQNWTNYNVETQKLQRNSDLRINAPMESIQETAANLKDKINHNEQDQIPAAYEKYLAAVKSAYGEGNEEELNSRALALYTQLNGGSSLVQDLRNSGHSSFVQGIIQSLTMSTYGRKSAEDNIAEITHQEVPTGEKASQNAGRVVGIAGVGAATYGVTKLILGAVKGAAKGVSKKAGIVGLIAAGIVGLATILTSKVST